MLKMLSNHKELKLIYSFNDIPSSSWDYAHNLGYCFGASSFNNDNFTPYLNKLINDGILTKVYEFVENEIRECLYQFKDGTEIETFGNHHMDLRIIYNY